MNSKKVYTVKNIVFIILTVIATFWFIFALLSGSDGTLIGFLKNSPNALPWLILYALIYAAYKWQRIGGILLTLLGIMTFFMFDAREQPIIIPMIPLPLVAIGIYLIWNYYKNKN